MMRNPDWAKRLHEAIQAAIERPFLWGENDCCLFAADCCAAVCGVDPAADYRGRYTTETGAKRALAKRHGSLEAAWDACFQRVEPAMAQRGDVCVHEAPEGRAVAVRWAGAWWGLTVQGATRIQAEPLIVWRVE